jgi:hypothetical protein
VSILRRVGAFILIAFGTLGALASLSDLVTGKEPAWHLGGILLGGGLGLGGWSLWRSSEPRRTGAILLVSIAAYAALMGLEDLSAGREAILPLLVVELRLSVAALVCAVLLWRGLAARQIGAALVVLWAASFTIEALAYEKDPVVAVTLIARSGAPGFVCAWLMWRGDELRRIAAVLLVSWPTSYMIYALHGADWQSAGGDVVIGLPTVFVGCLLWSRCEPLAASKAAGTMTVAPDDGPGSTLS